MLIGACGIACEVCRCYVENVCPGCTSGKDAAQKLEKQKQTLGFTCPVLECAFKQKIDYCMKNCKEFPCKVFYEAEFPFSKKFLDAMKRQ
ncbi:hypothetical protein DRO26_02260 [Candidatus Bathyarchaeota archaeon]|nr:MAG: hypothetical protein DRO26_02260 [Candidatus Bathyarchaeota archaeon]